jgi:ATP-dependent RNA helicase DeaD
MENFRKLKISEEILKALSEMKFENPTEIQEKAIPFVLQGRDVIAGASTGSGKTLAFGSGIIQNCEKLGRIQALILVPTRELAEQVCKSFKNFSKYKSLEIAAIYGGVSINPQIKQLYHADVVVGTPGRILDHLERRTIDLSEVKILVLDEADRMLDMGFIDDVESIIKRCPEFRQTLLFSATIQGKIGTLAKRYMSDPVEVMAESYVDPSKLTQIYYDVEDNQKFSLLVHLLKNDKSGLVMVFCNTQRNTDFVAKNLKLLGINALAIHGGHSQDKRTRTMDKFHAKDVDVLVCTDVAARGLDIKEVSHVYNYDSPMEANNYVHRIGRTARAGADGKAVNIIAQRDYENFTKIKRQHPEIERQDVPEFSRVSIGFKHESRFDNRGFRGGFSGNRGRFGGNRNFRRDDRGFGNSSGNDRDERSFSRHSNFRSRNSRRERRFERGRRF